MSIKLEKVLEMACANNAMSLQAHCQDHNELRDKLDATNESVAQSHRLQSFTALAAAVTSSALIGCGIVRPSWAKTCEQVTNAVLVNAKDVVSSLCQERTSKNSSQFAVAQALEREDKEAETGSNQTLERMLQQLAEQQAANWRA